jgi:hypothetical protein
LLLFQRHHNLAFQLRFTFAAFARGMLKALGTLAGWVLMSAQVSRADLPPVVTASTFVPSHEPRLVLEVNGIDWLDVRLGLTLKVTMESAHLEVLDGRLLSVSLGEPTGALSLHCQGQEVAAFKRAVNSKPQRRCPGSATCTVTRCLTPGM